jgi:hypothetical protein
MSRKIVPDISSFQCVRREFEFVENVFACMTGLPAGFQIFKFCIFVMAPDIMIVTLNFQ